MMEVRSWKLEVKEVDMEIMTYLLKIIKNITDYS
jgi:hypothetical protein